jgi:N4-gp56 family major capsid protein
MKRSFIENLRATTRFWELGEANGESMVGYGTFSRPRFIRLNKTANDVLLVEGVTPDSVDFKIESIEVRPTQYGMLGVISDRLEKMSLLNLIPRMAEEIGDNMARIIDKVVQATLITELDNQLLANGTIYNPTNLATMTATDILTPQIDARAWNRLDVWGAKKFGDHYLAVSHGNNVYDLKMQAGQNTWVDFHKYNAQQAIFSGEVGMLFGIRHITSSNIDVNPNSPSGVYVYPVFYFGRNSFGIAKLAPYSTHYVGFGASHSDGLAQRASVGVKLDFGTAVLQQQAALIVWCSSAINDAWATNVDGTVVL